MYCSKPRRANDRRVRHRAFKSIFVNPPQTAPFRYFLDSREYAATIGCDVRQIRSWQSEWKKNGFGPGVEPVCIEGVHRYRWDQITSAPEGSTFLDLMRRDLAEYVRATSAADASRGVSTNR
jgi:hypothetical protein